MLKHYSILIMGLCAFLLMLPACQDQGKSVAESPLAYPTKDQPYQFDPNALKPKKEKTEKSSEGAPKTPTDLVRPSSTIR